MAFMVTPPFSLLPPGFEAEQHQHQREDHQEHQQRRHRKALVAQVLEVVVHEMLQHVDALVGVGPAQQVGFPEGLEGVDDGHDQDKEEGGHQQRQRDVPHGLPVAGALTGGGLPVFLGDGGQPGQEQDQVVAAVFPDVQPDQNREGVFRLDPILNRQAQGGQQLVDEPPVREKRLHDDDHRRRGQHQRVQEQRAEEGRALELVEQQQRQQEGKDHQQRHADDDEPECVAGRQPEGRAAENIQVVAQPHKGGAARAAGKGEADAPQKGDQVKPGEADQKRQRQQIPGQGVSCFQFHGKTSHRMAAIDSLFWCIAELLCLIFIEFCKSAPLLGEQLIAGTIFQDSAVFQQDDPIR